MSSAPFAAGRYELPGPDGGTPLVVEPLPASEAEELGRAFAAIDPWARYPYPPSHLYAYFAAREAGAPRFILRQDGETTGAAGVRLNWLRGPYIQFLGILPAFQGLGLGARVLAWIEAESRTAGERNLWVAASDFNEGAIRFYERSGFVAIARLPDLVRDGRTEILLRKQL